MSMSRPSLAEVRATGQPPQVLARLNDEHWAGRLYMRRLSPYATLMFARLGWSPNAVTVAFMVSGIAAGVLTAVPGLAAAVGVFLLIQLYLLFDCSDGELARWSGRTSATGIYLDLIGHYLGEAALLIGLGLRAQGHLTDTGPYVSAGLAAAVLVFVAVGPQLRVVSDETNNIGVARTIAEEHRLINATQLIYHANTVTTLGYTVAAPPSTPAGRSRWPSCSSGRRGGARASAGTSTT